MIRIIKIEKLINIQKLRFKMLFIICFLSFLFSQQLCAQLNIFRGLKSNQKLAEYYKEKGNYQELKRLYSFMATKNKYQPQIFIELAHIYSLLNEPKKSIEYYNKFRKADSLGQAELLNYAQLQIEVNNVDKALEELKEYVKKYPDDIRGNKWFFSLRNMKYYYEDSIHYRIRKLQINSTSSDYSPFLAKNSIYFTSQRKNYSLSKVIDPLTGFNQSKIYQSQYKIDTLDINQKWVFEKPKKIKLDLPFKNVWKILFYNDETSIILTKRFSAKNGESSIGLFFADKNENEWSDLIPFSFNNLDYQIMNPTISTDGNTLYFASNMEGTIGGYDIFYSKKNSAGEWMMPKNIGERVNTKGNEITPFFFNKNELYFSSNGHGGLGAYDIFMARIYGVTTNVPRNLGYPVNSNKNDSGLILTKNGQLGFFNSNRSNGKFDEDIYQVYIDLQTYPLEIKCNLDIVMDEMNSPNIKDEIFSNGVYIELIDDFSDDVLYTTQLKNSDLTNTQNDFNIQIPYANQFLLRMTTQNTVQTFVALEFPIIKKDHSQHFIKINPEWVKDTH